MSYKEVAKKLINRAGFDIVKQRDLFKDLAVLLKNNSNPLILDVGANVGQSVETFKKSFPNAVIHSFEPSPKTFATLSENCKKFTNVNTWNCGVGSTKGTLPFLENSESVLSSFLEPGTQCWGNIERTTNVNVITLDEFAAEHNITTVDLLKSDTQGFELEVFKGASGLMKNNRIKVVYFEFTFSDMYKELPKFDEVFKFFTDHNFLFAGLYDPHYQNGLIGWADLMFVNAEFHKNGR